MEAIGLVIAVVGGVSLGVTSLERLQGLILSSHLGVREPPIAELEAKLVLLHQDLRSVLTAALQPNLYEGDVDILLSLRDNAAWQGSAAQSRAMLMFPPSELRIFTGYLFRILDTTTAINKSLATITRSTKLSKNLLASIRFKRVLEQVHDGIAIIERETQGLASFLAVRSTVGVRGSVEVPAVQVSEDDVEVSRQEASALLSEFSDDDLDEDDTRSQFSTQTELEDEAPTLSYLALTVKSTDGVHTEWRDYALLDSGASLCTVSLDTTLNLGLKLEPADVEAVTTSFQDQSLQVAGRVKLECCWQNRDNTKERARLWFYSVYGLGHSLLLSHDFILKHPEVWQSATVNESVIAQVNLTWFKKLSAQQEQAVEEFRAGREAEHRAIDEAEKQRRLVEIDRRLAGGTSSPSVIASSSDSISVSVQGSTLDSVPSTATS